MNKRNKLIVSIVGITIVLLALLGITYAYYLTRIQGNTNTNSISITTAKLELVYGDNSAEIIEGTVALVPDSDNAIGTKTFTVTNNGNDSSYVVIIDNVSTKLAGTNTNTTFISNDFRYTLICTKSDGTNCNDVSELTVFPINGGILVGNDIAEGDIHSYTLTMWYIDTGMDQSDDMGKSYQARVNIADVSELENPFATGVTETDESSLLYNIINSAQSEKNGTSFVNVPLTKPGQETSSFKYKTNEYDQFTYLYGGESMNVNETYQGYYWTYGSGFVVDENTGKFTLTGVSTCQYNDGTCHENLVGKYIISLVASNNSNSTNIQKETSNLSDIYIVTEAPESSSSEINLSLKTISPVKYSTEKELSITTDDYGISYYYRGGVEDNYVNFANMCWRIVRIQGDGSIKLILDDINVECNNASYGANYIYNDSNITLLTSGNNIYANYDWGILDVFKSFENNKLSNVLDKLKADNWCYDNSYINGGYGYDADGNTTTIKEEATSIWWDAFYYGAYSRIYTEKNPSLICKGQKINKYSDDTNMYVGTLTADEASFAGEGNETHYLASKMDGIYPNNSWTLLSPAYYEQQNYTDSIFIMNSSGSLNNSESASIRPAITLKNTTQISDGDGTKTNPYVIQ